MSFTVIIESKDQIIEKTTDDRGRLNLGTEFADTDVQIAVLDAEEASDAPDGEPGVAEEWPAD